MNNPCGLTDKEISRILRAKWGGARSGSRANHSKWNRTYWAKLKADPLRHAEHKRRRLEWDRKRRLLRKIMHQAKKCI